MLVSKYFLSNYFVAFGNLLFILIYLKLNNIFIFNRYNKLKFFLLGSTYVANFFLMLYVAFGN
jgi:energy-coupling factor transporter transmembrane protein EcfT